MKIRTLIALTACGGTLIANSTSDAAFLGIEVVIASSWMSTTGPINFRNSYNAAGGPEVFQIFRVFAKFDNTGAANPNNRVNSISGVVGNSWSLNVSHGSVYNWTQPALPTTLHNDLAPLSNSPSSFVHGWETWATIGTQNTPSAATFTPGAHNGQLNHFQGNFSATDAALYITPDDLHGNAITLNNTSANGMGGNGFGVLLMQITVTPGTRLTMTHNLSIGGVGNVQEINGLSLFFPVAPPTPGTLAVLGLGGLISSRRRD